MRSNTERSTWQNRRLGELFRLKHGYAFKSEYFADHGPYVLLTPGNFYDQGGFRLKGEKEKYYTGEVSSSFVLKRGDLLVVMTEQAEGLLGSPAIIPENNKYLHNQRLGLVTDLKEEIIEKKFLYFLFNSRTVRSQIRASASGVKVRHTSPERIYEVKVIIPPVLVQQKIATVLSAYESLIENNLRRIKILEQIAQTLYREWFVKFRFPGHQKVRMVNSPLGKIPEGWEVLNVENIVKRHPPGKLYEQKTVYAEGTVPVLDQGRSGVIGYHNDSPGVETNEENPVIIFANHTCYQRIIHFPFSAIQNVIPFYPNPDHYRNIYWLHYATKDLISFNDYKGHWPEYMGKKVVVPTIQVAEDFGSHIKPNILLVFMLQKKCKNLSQTRDLLLPKLISGKLDVSELDITIPEAKA